MIVKTLRLIFALVVSSGVLAIPTLANQAQDWTDFQTCISSASGPQWNGTTGTCTLPYYSQPYTTSSTISISSSSVRVVSTGNSGTVSTSPQATIQRNVSSVTSNTTPFAILSATSATHDLLLEYLTIDGNREGFSNSSSSNILLCVCAIGVASCPSGGTPTPGSGPNWIDVNLSSAGFSSAAAYHGASVQYMNFNNAPAFALLMGQWGFVYASTFQYARYTAIYTNSHNNIPYNTIEYSGSNGIMIEGPDVLVDWNVLTQNHDEWSWSDGSPGGQIFADHGVSNPNLTILGNAIDGNHAECTSGSGCDVSPVTTTSSTLSCHVAYAPDLKTIGIETWQAGGTYTDNYITNHKYAGAFFGGNIDGSGIGSVAGAFSSTSAGQAMTFVNDSNPGGPGFIHLNSGDGVLLYYQSGVSGSFGGTFSFSNLVSTSNGAYGFEWNTSAPLITGTTLNWGSGGTACLTSNSSGSIGTMPSGYPSANLLAPSSTTTCP